MGDGAKYPWVFQEAIVRDNYLRKVGGAPDPESYLTRAIILTSTQNLIVESNIIWDMNQNPGTNQYHRAHTIDYADSQAAKAFNNQYPIGKLIQAFNDPSWYNNTDYWLDEIETLAEDVVWAWSDKRKFP